MCRCCIGLRIQPTGGPRWGWAPNLPVWAALVTGSLCGAPAYHRINLAAAIVALARGAIVAATIHV